MYTDLKEKLCYCDACHMLDLGFHALNLSVMEFSVLLSLPLNTHLDLYSFRLTFVFWICSRAGI